MQFRFGDLAWNFPSRCVIFGILNVTSDSFSDGGRFVSAKVALQHALALEKAGADAIDLGGESTRPGSTAVSAGEELDRVLPVLKLLRKQLRIPISIDTTKAEVAEKALREGVVIVNDISGLRADPAMTEVIAASNAGVILMHSRGTPATMQMLCDYTEVVDEVKRELGESVEHALNSGIPNDRIAIDPGIGFAKTKEQNRELLHELHRFTGTYPVMIGISRKSFLGGPVSDRGKATLEGELQAWTQGIQMIRTHDVAALRSHLKS